MRKNLPQIISLAAGLLIFIAFFVAHNLGNSWEFALRIRFTQIAAMLIVSCCVAYSSVAFQTLTSNRILTPSIMGFESVYLLLQTFLVYLYGDVTYSVINHLDNFLLSILCMIGFAFMLYFFIFRKGVDNIFLLVLIGLVLGTLFNSISSFFQLIIDPNDFFMVQSKMFASFSNINDALLGYSAIILTVTLGIGFQQAKFLDLIALGKDKSRSLGLNYNKKVQLFLVLIAIMVSISTALIGPIIFLGILVANLTYELIKTYQHRVIIGACCLVTANIMIGGHFISERILDLSTPISTIINFIGGIYFLYLILRMKKI